MTIAKTDARKQYAGNGSTTPFSFPYRFFADSDLQVYLLVDATGVETLQTLTTHYTVANNGDETGGTVTMVTAPATGETLTILRAVPQTQGTDYAANDPFPAETHETALDRLTLVDQQQEEVIGRTIKLSSSSALTDIELPTPSAGKALQWDVAETGLENSTATIDTAVVDAAASAAAALVSENAAAASAVSSAADVVTTNADVVITTQDAIDTAADAVSTAADVISAAASAAAADVAKIEWQGAWVTTTVYALNDAVEEAGSSYICIVAHTAGVFATDLAALKWELLAQKGAGSLSNIVEDTTPQLGGTLDTNSKAIFESQGADVASATELLVLTDGNVFDITGTTNISTIENTADAFGIGATIRVKFLGILTLVNSASLALIGGANITVAVGDFADFTKTASGVWDMSAEAIASIGYNTAALKTDLNVTGSAPMFACRAWVNFNGTGVVAIRESGNVSSITDNGTGEYTVNFSVSMPNANYATAITYGDITTGANLQLRKMFAGSVNSQRFFITIDNSGTGFDTDNTHAAFFA